MQEAVGNLFDGLSPEQAFIAGIACAGAMAFEWICLSNVLGKLFDLLACFVEWLWKCIRKK